MADVKMPKSVPCQFSIAWKGPCGKPSTNGWCSEHENLRCASCSSKAIRNCDNEYCGANVCRTCSHAVALPGEGPRYDHVTNEVAKKLWDEWRRLDHEERESDKAIRERGVPLGLPRHLKELLGGDRSGYALKTAYSLQIKHDLMGYFPAIVKAAPRVIVLTLDKEAIFRVWMSLDPRESTLEVWEYMVNESVGVAYPMRIGEIDQKFSRPNKLMTTAEIEMLLEKDPHPFKWAPGLLGTSSFREQFMRDIEKAAATFGVTLPAFSP